ncbi:hypothetical protein [Rhizobium sp. BK176]|uniref:hypothetical protein n=1 Tax=Rhizobium sp. BK176 TaxID=2587071 RepID=UPI00216AAB59|nr:hypothetical protein [Rhizobium sp. BK176]MCS4089193.1 hypothetical protein [Rhizobium sp. BK176]
MGGYCYGEAEPAEECGLCGGDAYAEFCDVGVGMVQISPYHCGDCGSSLSPLLPDGSYANGWVPPPTASERGARVTGYYITHVGHVIEMTFDEGHLEFDQRTGHTTSGRLYQGWVRITNLEGFAIDLPPAMSLKTRRSLAKIVKDIDTTQNWGVAYVMQSGSDRGQEMTRAQIMSVASRLPTEIPTTERVHAVETPPFKPF